METIRVDVYTGSWRDTKPTRHEFEFEDQAEATAFGLLAEKALDVERVLLWQSIDGSK